MSRSELVKVDEPGKCNFKPRTAYYIQVNFTVCNFNAAVKMKVDTGSAYTIIGLRHHGITPFIDNILTGREHAVAYDAQSKEMDLIACVVKGFQLTEEIKFPAMKIWFSEQLGEKPCWAWMYLVYLTFSILGNVIAITGHCG